MEFCRTEILNRDLLKRSFEQKFQWILKENESKMAVLGGPTLQVFYVSIFAGLILAGGFILFYKYGDFMGFSEDTSDVTPQPEIVQRILLSIAHNSSK